MTGDGLAKLAGVPALTTLDLRGVRLRTDDLKAVGRLTTLRVLLLPAVEPAEGTRPRSVSADAGNDFPGRPPEAGEYPALPEGTIDYQAGLKHLAGLVNLQGVEMTRVFEAAPAGRRTPAAARDDAPLIRLESPGIFFGRLLDQKSPGEVFRMLGIRADATGVLVDRKNKPLRESDPELARFLSRPSGALLAHIRDYRHVTSLDPSGFMVRDDDLRHLAGHTGLERLDLSGSPITARGLAHLKGLPRLKYLNLRGADIEDGDLPAARELTSLRDVVLSQSRVTEAGAETFRRGLLRAVYDPKQKRPDWCAVKWRTLLEAASR